MLDYIFDCQVTSSTFFEKEDLVVRLVELLVSVSDDDLSLILGGKISENFYPLLVPSGGKRTGSLYFTSEKDVSTPSPSVPILNLSKSEKRGFT